MTTENKIEQEQDPSEKTDTSFIGYSNNISKSFISFLFLVIIFLIIMGIFILSLY